MTLRPVITRVQWQLLDKRVIADSPAVLFFRPEDPTVARMDWIAVYASSKATTVRSEPQPLNASTIVTGLEPELIALLNQVLPDGHENKITRAEVDALTLALAYLRFVNYNTSDLLPLRDKLEALLPPAHSTTEAP